MEYIIGKKYKLINNAYGQCLGGSVYIQELKYFFQGFDINKGFKDYAVFVDKENVIIRIPTADGNDQHYIEEIKEEKTMNQYVINNKYELISSAYGVLKNSFRLINVSIGTILTLKSMTYKSRYYELILKSDSPDEITVSIPDDDGNAERYLKSIKLEDEVEALTENTTSKLFLAEEEFARLI